MMEPDEFADMPVPRGGMSSATAVAALERAIETERKQTDVLRRRGAWRFARESDCYRRTGPSKSTETGRARRILSPLTASCERHRHDDGDIAHIVTLGDPLDRPGVDIQAWCGARITGSRKWSGLRAFSTCPACRALAGPAIHGEAEGTVHLIAETDRLAARRLIDPALQMEMTNAYLENLRQNEEERRLRREQHAKLARRARNPFRRAFRWFRSLAA